MIKKESMEIVSVKEIAKDTVEMLLKNDYISEHALPGQFLHISVQGHTLRRPISIANADAESKIITILFKKLGSGTDGLAEYRPGDSLDVLGPAGNGFPTADITKESHVLLVGGGIGVPPIYFLANHLAKQNIKVTAVLGYQASDYVFYHEEFKSLGKIYTVTNDGSFGRKGLVTDVFSEIEDFDSYYSCGPMPMLKAVAANLENKTGYLSFEERMGCGVGACFACVIPTNDEAQYKKICSDGPVFKASEVIL